MSEFSESNGLWSNICTWIKNRLNMDMCLSSQDKILAYVSNNSNFVPLNFVLIHSRKYIFWCAKNTYKLNFYMLQQILKKCFFLKKKLWRNCTLNWRGLIVFGQTGKTVCELLKYILHFITINIYVTR